MKKYKLFSLLLVGVMLVGCGTTQTHQEQEVTSEASTQVEVKDEGELTSQEKINQPFVLSHTEDLKAMGYEDIVLEEEPQRIVLMSTYPFHTLNDLGISDQIIAVASSSSARYPEDLKAEILPSSAMGGAVDTEKIISLEPDLVVLPESAMAVAGQTLQDVGITVYAVGMQDMSGEKNTYEYTKEQAEVLIEAFANSDEKLVAGQAILGEFAALEERIEDFKANHPSKTYLSTMVVSETDSYANTSSSIIGVMLEMFGYENLYEQISGIEGAAGHGASPVNLESLVDVETDLFVFLTTDSEQAAADQKIAAMIANNEKVWSIVPAVGRGDYIVLTSNYFVSAGILMIDNMNDLLDVIESWTAN